MDEHQGKEMSKQDLDRLLNELAKLDKTPELPKQQETPKQATPKESEAKPTEAAKLDVNPKY